MQSSKYNQGDIFVAKSPFSDFEGNKTRPVLIISPSDYNNSFEDVVILSITTQYKDSKSSVLINNTNLIEEKLRLDSTIRIDKPYSILKNLLEHKITSLNNNTLIKVKEKIKKFYEL